jgi:large subunit ribosomal protein L4
VDQLNAYDVLVTDEVVFTSAALQAYVNRGSGTVAEGASDEAEDASDETRGAAEEDEK